MKAKKPPKSKHVGDDHHENVWSSGGRGGGKVPADIDWGTNPKQWQEEHGTAEPAKKKDEPKK